nr:hypothetical protein [Lactococcus petauri]
MLVIKEMAEHLAIRLRKGNKLAGLKPCLKMISMGANKKCCSEL